MTRASFLRYASSSTFLYKLERNRAVFFLVEETCARKWRTYITRSTSDVQVFCASFLSVCHVYYYTATKS